MSKWLKVFTLLSAAIYTGPVYADEYIKNLKVSEGIAYFTTTSKKEQSLECVSTEYKNHWSLDVTSLSGQGNYLMLLNAASHFLPVEVISAHDCRLVPGVARAKSVSFVK